MLISVLGFGSIWMRRLPMEARVQERFDPRELAYYNTTGVAVEARFAIAHASMAWHGSTGAADSVRTVRIG